MYRGDMDWGQVNNIIKLFKFRNKLLLSDRQSVLLGPAKDSESKKSAGQWYQNLYCRPRNTTISPWLPIVIHKMHTTAISPCTRSLKMNEE